jgi:hypothetical protein
MKERHHYLVNAVNYVFIQSLPDRRDPLFFFYMLSSFACLLSCQLWKQAKWIDIHDKTSMLRNRGACQSKLTHYFEKCSELKTNNDKFEKFLKKKKKIKEMKDLSRMRMSILG